MVERLGKVLFWAGCIFAALIVAAGYELFGGTTGGDAWFYATVTLVTAGIVFLLGLAARYVLSGK